MYLNSAKQFDRKLAVILDIENNYQNILKQIKSINQLISDLTGPEFQ